MVVQCSSRKGKKRETGWIFEYRINLVFSIQHKDPDDNHISDLAVTPNIEHTFYKSRKTLRLWHQPCSEENADWLLVA
jgi:thiosulfate reductase cytochrome b subunit